jgi:hypothetical protein
LAKQVSSIHDGPELSPTEPSKEDFLCEFLSYDDSSPLTYLFENHLKVVREIVAFEQYHPLLSRMVMLLWWGMRTPYLQLDSTKV